MKKLAWPAYSKKEIDLIANISKSGRVNQWTGEYVQKFEKKYSKYFNLKYSIAVSNGTVGLEAALYALYLKKNSEVIVTPRSFIASASAVLKMGHTPVFSDIDLNSQNIELEQIKNVVTKKTKAIICVHLAGYPTRMKEIIEFAKNKNISVIEDCSQAHGSKINNKLIGTFGNISVWSFCQDKIISTLGEGGMICTNNLKFYKRLKSYRDHGKNFNSISSIKKFNKFNYINDFLGTNIRMTEVQAGVGYLQLDQLNKWIKKRNEKVKLLEKYLQKIDTGIILIKVPSHIKHAYYRYYFFIDQSTFKRNWNYDRLITELRKKNSSFFIGGCPEIYKEKIFKQFLPKKDLVNTKLLSKCSICLPINQNLSNKEILNIYKIIKKIFTQAFNK